MNRNSRNTSLPPAPAQRTPHKDSPSEKLKRLEKDHLQLQQEHLKLQNHYLELQTQLLALQNQVKGRFEYTQKLPRPF